METSTIQRFEKTENLTVEKLNALVETLREHRPKHTVWNVGSKPMFSTWADMNGVSKKNIAFDKPSIYDSFSGVEIHETAALSPYQVALVENGIIRGVFSLIPKHLLPDAPPHTKDEGR